MASISIFLRGLVKAASEAALPFSVILLLICYCLVKALYQEEAERLGGLAPAMPLRNS